MNLLLLLVALSFSEAVPLQGAAECQPQSRPWHVRLGRSCSGALVDPRWIVTSFACAPLSSNITASLGDHDVSVAEGTEQHIDTDLTVLHSPYRSPFHSLAMVRLAKPARFNQYVQPIPLPSRCPQPGETCRVSGWGSTVPNQDESPKRLKCISVPVVDDRTCRELFPMHWSHGMVCAGQVDGTNCLDDRGAVMECGGQLQGVQWYSFGCSNPPDPSTYSRICQYTRWMRDVMRNNSPTSAPTTPHPPTPHSTLPPTTPPSSVKEGAEGVQPVQGAL
ncbi:trypsinogen-like protein 3 [Takifugu rubripes]|uniref:Trypsinogen-like protein 3 n=1 Tax=Takifugu rubripes TaxID=31033 RepID=H2S4V0_TAKRU|nr:trypsinogen-like protein 3 [Takifugu rubripes]|eukprot:XP_003976944.2 PREDICTED: trypsinogen-like protein 3 [Takifugu rubripes]